MDLDMALEVLELSDWALKMTMINMLRALIETVDVMEEQVM